MRKYVIPILFFLILVTPFVLRVVLGAKTTAKPSPSATPLVVLTSHAEGIRREFGQAFQGWYKKEYGQDVYIDYIALATNEMSNLLKDRKSSVFSDPNIRTYQIDIVWGGGDFYFDNVFAPYLKELKLDPELMKQAFPNPTLGGLPLYDQNPKHAVPHWYGAALSSFGFTYNKQVVKYLQLPEPKTWRDLEHPQYKNWLALGDPVASGSIKQAFMAIVEKSMADATANHESEDIGWQRGMGEVRMICANARTFSSGSNLIPGLISSGNAAAGMTIDMYGHAEVDAVPDGRLAYVQPVGETVINPDPIAITAGVENDGPGREIIAQRFVEFVLSRQGQLLWMKKAGTAGGPISTDLYRLPIMPSVYTDLTDSTVNENPFTAARGFNKSNAREKTFNILGDLIQCSCIDCLAELQKARFDILRSKRARELTNRLNLFPFDQKEALRRSAAYVAAAPVDKLALKRQWTEEFKAEYQTLRDEAKQ
jgi:iron(III) transport system substrate-binding protein